MQNLRIYSIIEIKWKVNNISVLASKYNFFGWHGKIVIKPNFPVEYLPIYFKQIIAKKQGTAVGITAQKMKKCWTENFFFCAMDLQLPKTKYHLQITFDMIKDFWINGQCKWKMKEVLKSNLIESSNRFKSLQWAWAI